MLKGADSLKFIFRHTQKLFWWKIISNGKLHNQKRKLSMDFPWETIKRAFMVCPWGSTGDYGNRIYRASEEIENNKR